jgi:ABC-2 type transport system ATP-binding protein
MEEAESLCDELAIIDHGRIIARGTLPELRRLTGERDLVRLSGRFDPPRVAEALRTLPGVESIQLETETVSLGVLQASKELPELLGALAATGAEIRETILTQPNLESLFIKLTGKEFRE